MVSARKANSSSNFVINEFLGVTFIIRRKKLVWRPDEANEKKIEGDIVLYFDYFKQRNLSKSRYVCE